MDNETKDIIGSLNKPPKEQVEGALECLSICANEAAKVQALLESVTQWKEKLMYLVGHRISCNLPASSASFSKSDSYIKIINSEHEIAITGEKADFQRLACEILAVYPIMPTK